MRRLPDKTILGEQECPGCGHPVAVKENRAGGVYFYCARVVGEREGKPERCMTRLNMGRMGSQKIIDQFLATKQEITDVQPQHAAEQSGTADQHPAVAATKSIGAGFWSIFGLDD
jgi:hypothetical protein